MRRVLNLIMVLAAIALGTLLQATSSGASSQSTPAAGASRGPFRGDHVRIADSDGTELGTITVPFFTDHIDPNRPPAPGNRMVFVCLSISLTFGDPLVLGPADFAVLYENGFPYEPDDPGIELDDCPAFFGKEFAPGVTDGGAITFQLPEDADLDQILFEHGDRRQPLIDTRDARPRYGDAVPILAIDGSELATISVSAPADPPTPSNDDGRRYITFPASVTNTGALPFDLNPSHFSMIDTDGFATREAPRGPEQSGPSGPYLQPNPSLAPGETASGLVRFKIRDGADPVAVVFHPDSDRLVYLAESGIPPTPAVSTPAANSGTIDASAITPTPGCEGVIEWTESYIARIEAALSDDSALAQVDAAETVPSLEPALIRQAATEARSIADAQSSSDPPPIAADANEALAAEFQRFADHLDALADALQANDQSAIDAALAGIDEFGGDALVTSFEALGDSFPEFEEFVG